ncbi:MAG: 50S ribosomal protein L3 [Bacillota bacterium]
MDKGIIGKKVGMTEVFDEQGRAIPVTVIQAGPCVVVQKKAVDSDGYAAVQMGFSEVPERRVNKPLKGHFGKAGVKPTRYLKEFRLKGDWEVGQTVTAAVFAPGDLVDVAGTSKGKGFAGGIKRWGFHRGPMAHGSKYHRAPGSLQSRDASRVFKGRRLPGRLGGGRVTVQGLKVIKVDPHRGLLLVKGAVPGIRGSIVMVRNSFKAR